MMLFHLIKYVLGKYSRTILWMVAGNFMAVTSIYAQDGTDNPETLLLKDYRPRSIYNIPITEVTKAKYPVIDMHSHDYVVTPEEIKEWVERMEAFNIEKTIILTYATGASFDSIYNKYAPFGDKFEVWCGFDFTGYEKKGWDKKAVKELERCYKVGARGVGELGDKGQGLVYSKPTPAYGMHIDDPRMEPLLKKCAELKMPIQIHVAEPYWMYEPMDKHNDGLMNAFKWKIDKEEASRLSHEALIQSLRNAVLNNPNTIFIASHFANCSYDLSILSELLDESPNLYADISARYGETSTIPRYMFDFYVRHQDKLLYGTDMGTDSEMYETTIRILETNDEHFYKTHMFHYHWASNGFGLPDEVLEKVYRKNALKIINQKQ